MRCMRCDVENPGGRDLCSACGAPLVIVCPRCSAESPPRFQYCGHCAAPLAQPIPESAAERRQLTVMFCDLVAATSLSEQLDPEDLRDVLQNYQAVSAAAIGRFGGQVAQYLGDGILAYFGYPLAHEDDPQRAVRAGLEILSDTGRLSARIERQWHERLAVRIGIHTGLVVAGEIGTGGRRETVAVGETPNVAARLQNLAEPNTLLISAATHRLVHGFFECQPRGVHPLKGVSHPLAVYRVTGQTDAQSRVDFAAAAALTPLVGREHELVQLRRLWDAAASGTGRLVLLGGEAGIGKSRLLKAFGDRIHAAAFTRLRYYCSEQHMSSPLYPVIRQVERAAGLKREDPPATQLDKLEALLAPSAPSREELALMAELLSLPGAAERYPALDLTPQRQRQKSFAALIRQVETLAARGPVLMEFEDVHWIDPSSRELLEIMAARVSHLPILLIVTFRPEFQSRWAGGAHAVSMVLSRLGEAERKAMVERIAGGCALPERTVHEIAERSDGVPLFIEELTRAVLDAGDRVTDVPQAAGAGTGLAVPASLNSSLLARLDRLGTAAKEVAQIGAAIGRQFYYGLLAAVAQKSEPELMLALEALGEAALLTRRGTPPEATYIFKHALVQDAAYATLLRGRRRELHAAIAKQLELRHSGDTASQELLAHHCTQAGLYREAVRAWKAAARQSVARGSFAEAQAQLRTGLALLDQLPGNAERDRKEVTLQNALGNVLIAQRGYTAPETLSAFERARVLAAGLNDPGQGLRALWGLGTALLFAGKLSAVLEMMQEAAPLVEKNRHLDARLAFSVVHGSVLLDLGRLREANAQLENTLAMDSDPGRDGERAILYGQSPRISALGCLSVASLLLGQAEKSRQQSEQSIREAHALSHKPMLCLALSSACRRDWLAGAKEALGLHAAALQRLAADQGTPLWLALSKTYLGWSLAEEGKLEEGIALMYEGMGEYKASGANSATPLLFLALGRACTRVGRNAEAFDFLRDALRGGSAGEERWLEAEVEREQGEMLLGRHEFAAAEHAFRRAIAVARRQGARLFELRAGTCLGRLLLAQSRSRDALDVLVPLCGVDSRGRPATDLPNDLAALFAEASSAQARHRGPFA
jgi:predicted ATPase/class 3 adenylate cyclase